MATKPMKSKLYKKYSMSKKKYPTIEKRGSKGGSGGGVIIGHTSAKRALEGQLGRPLHSVPGKKVRTSGGNWIFYEWRNPPQSEEAQ